MTNKLKDLIEDLRVNHEFCPKEVILQTADYLEILSQRTWVGLTDEEKASFWTADQMTQQEWDELFISIETKLKEKNDSPL